MQLKAEDFTLLGLSDSENEIPSGKPMTYLQDAWRRFRKNKIALGAAILLLLIVMYTIFAPMFSRWDFTEIDTTCRNQGPSIQHWFGTDSL